MLPASSQEITLSSSSKGQLCHRFTLAEIQAATKNFKGSSVLGHGGFGRVYKGTISYGRKIDVAIKRLDSSSHQGALEFQAEIEMLPLSQHPNIVSLIGCYSDDREMILVYEYMSNGALSKHLYDHRTPLSWPQRLKICIDAARALDYLHTGSERGVIHRDVKSSHILLDKQWSAKLTNFGLSKILPIDNVHVSTTIAGTVGYLDPEYMLTGRVSMKSDVYSFGVILLEVLCGRRAVDMSLDDEQKVLVEWAKKSMRKGKLKHIIDPDLKGKISLKCLNDYAKIVEHCLRERQEQRITMAEVVIRLESILALQEQTGDSIPQMEINTTPIKRLKKYFLTSGHNTGGSYLRKAVKFLSAKSLEHKGDHDHIADSMSDTMSDIDVMSNISYAVGSGRKNKNLFPYAKYDSASEPSQTESLTFSDYLQRALLLARRKDFLHLIWFYPMKKEAEEFDFGSLINKFSSLNKYIRKSLDSSTDEDYLMEVQTLVQDIEEHLDAASFDMIPYFSEDSMQNTSGSTSFWSSIPEIHESAIASATHRALNCIKDLKVKRLGISGNDAEEVAETLKNLPELTSVFDVILSVRVKSHSIEELMNDIEQEIRLLKQRSAKIILDQFKNCLLFVDCSDVFIDLNESEFNLSKWFGNVQIVMINGPQNAYCPVDFDIRIQDHLLPWILFSTNVDLVTLGNDSTIRKLATRLIEECHGHLLSIILLSNALRDVVDINIWELALQELTSQHEPSSSQSGVTSDVMVKVLKFIWSRMEVMSQRCIVQFASRYTGSELDKSTLMDIWIRDELVKNEQEGERVFEDLIRSFLLERVGENDVRMRDEIRVTILAHFANRSHELYLMKDGSKTNEIPNVEQWDCMEINLINNIVSELPDNPKSPILVNLILQSNQDLTDIPIAFFDSMPSLQVLDLSNSSIKCLPSSISKLTMLRKLFIRNCDLMMELPPEIGALKYLKVFDAEGTQLIRLPVEFELLTKLECLKLSLYNFADRYNPTQIVLVADLSKLVRLKELSICIDSYSEWWEDEVEYVIEILSKLRNLESFRLYFPTTKLVCIFMGTKNWEGVLIYEHLLNFSFVVGSLQQRVISRLPLDLEKAFIKLPNFLKYTNGEEDLFAIVGLLKHVDALFLDRHWTIQSLSTFEPEEIERLKFCLLAECNEMRDIVNVDEDEDEDEDSFIPFLGSLQYLGIYNMKSLGCIWNGPIRIGSLSNLKTLTMHGCPELTTVLTFGLLENLVHLEYLIVEDCPKVESLVSVDSDHSTSTYFLPRLKKISLVSLSELMSISNGICIAPRLESLVVYDCPNLEKLYPTEVCDQIKEIKGENEWWDALNWCEPEWTNGQPDHLARAFVPLGTDDDIMDELAEAVNVLPYLNE